jgi:signal transduction histidine kinase
MTQLPDATYAEQESLHFQVAARTWGMLYYRALNLIALPVVAVLSGGLADESSWFVAVLGLALLLNITLLALHFVGHSWADQWLPALFLDASLYTWLASLSGGLESNFVYFFFWLILHSAVRFEQSVSLSTGILAMACVGYLYTVSVNAGQDQAALAQLVVLSMILLGTALATAKIAQLIVKTRRNMLDATMDLVRAHKTIVSQQTTLRDNEQNLKEAVAQRTAELEATNKELEAFSYSVSHDLRAPLRSIDGFSRLLLEDYASMLDEEGRDRLQRVSKASQHMGELIEGMLSLSRIHRKELNDQTISLSHMAEEILRRLQENDSTRTVDYRVQDKLVIQGDHHLVKIALENMLGNAWKYTRTTEHPCIEFGATKKNDEMMFYIKDNGAGFEMQYAHKLFEPFQRLHTSNEFEGSGIGLATVARVINRHKGRIWGESEVGEGATFYFTLP